MSIHEWHIMLYVGAYGIFIALENVCGKKKHLNWTNTNLNLGAQWEALAYKSWL